MKWFWTLATAGLLMLGGVARGQAPYSGIDPQQLVETWYQHYLGRPADPGGLQSWSQNLTRQPPQRVLAEILSSQEYYQRNGGTPEGFVLGLYRDILGRTPYSLRPRDVQYWVNRVERSGNNRVRVIRHFLRDSHANIYNPPPEPATPQQTPYSAPWQGSPPTYSPSPQQYAPPAPAYQPYQPYYPQQPSYPYPH